MSNNIAKLLALPSAELGEYLLHEQPAIKLTKDWDLYAMKSVLPGDTEKVPIDDLLTLFLEINEGDFESDFKVPLAANSLIHLFGAHVEKSNTSDSLVTLVFWSDFQPNTPGAHRYAFYVRFKSQIITSVGFGFKGSNHVEQADIDKIVTDFYSKQKELSTEKILKNPNGPQWFGSF